MKAFLDTAGNDRPLCSASKYFNTSAFGGSCSVTTLKCKSVRAGHEALIIPEAVLSSVAESGARGCNGTVCAARGVTLVTSSVDIATKSKGIWRESLWKIFHALLRVLKPPAVG
jgi:hypothetical protein